MIDSMVEALIRRKEFALAGEMLEIARAAAPADAKILELRADPEFARGQNEEAVRRYDEALAAAEPPDASMIARRARALGRMRRYGEAAAGLREAVRLNPTNRSFRSHYARFLLFSGDLRGTLDQITEVLYLTPLAEAERDVEALIQGDFDRFTSRDRPEGGDRTRADTERLLAQSAMRPLLAPLMRRLVQRGQGAMKVSDHERAERCFSAAMICQPTAPEPYVGLARLYAETGAGMGAILAIERAAELGFRDFAGLSEQTWFQGLTAYPRVRRLVDSNGGEGK